jgi:hypothetical protein
VAADPRDFEAWLIDANNSILASLDAVVDTEENLSRIKAAGSADADATYDEIAAIKRREDL